jgi:hypothetical protein
MRPLVIRLLSLAAWAAAILPAGCAPHTGAGLPPTLDAADLELSTVNYVNVQDLLIRRAGFPDAVATGNWYPLAVAGYGYVDEKCNAFMDELFEADRRLRAGRNQVNDIANAVTAILSYTSTSRADIGIVASAFGLASKTIDNYQIVRLVDLGPAKVHKLVAKAQQAYRTQTYADRAKYTHQTYAMQAVAGYLDLCRVPTIVANIDRAIDIANFVPDTTDASLLPRLMVVGGQEASARDLRETAGLPGLKAFVPPAPTSRVIVQPPRKPDVPLVSGASVEFEEKITLSQGKRLQTALCAPPTGNLGDKATRDALRGYERGSNFVSAVRNVGRGHKIPVNGSIDNPSERNEILAVAECREHAHKYKNAFEKFAFPQQIFVEDLKRKVQAYIIKNAAAVRESAPDKKIPPTIATEEGASLIPNSAFAQGPEFTPELREAIGLIQQDLRVEASEEIDHDLYLKIVRQ